MGTVETVAAKFVVRMAAVVRVRMAATVMDHMAAADMDRMAITVMDHMAAAGTVRMVAMVADRMAAAVMDHMATVIMVHTAMNIIASGGIPETDTIATTITTIDTAVSRERVTTTIIAHIPAITGTTIPTMALPGRLMTLDRRSRSAFLCTDSCPLAMGPRPL